MTLDLPQTRYWVCHKRDTGFATSVIFGLSQARRDKVDLFQRLFTSFGSKGNNPRKRAQVDRYNAYVPWFWTLDVTYTQFTKVYKPRPFFLHTFKDIN